jgi:hypothetical protein
LKRSKERSEIAWMALRAYGGAAVEPLIKARAPSALIDECRGIPIADQIVIRKLKEKGVTVELTNAPLTAAWTTSGRSAERTSTSPASTTPTDHGHAQASHRLGLSVLEALSEITNIPSR